MTIQHVIGIDPGKTGAVARFTPSTGKLLVLDMPTVLISRAKGEKKFLDHDTLARLMKGLVGDAAHETEGFIEQVASRPGQGVVSVFDFGVSYGAARQLLAGATLWNTTPVPPQVWKRALGLPPGADKALSRQLASTLFPSHTALFKRVKDDGRAEASLIAYYGARKLGLVP